MGISYARLWDLLQARGMLKKDLREATGLCLATIAKLSKNQNVTTDVLVRICDALKCDLSDIAEIISDDQ